MPKLNESEYFFRKTIDDLAALISEEYKIDVFDNTLFTFCGTRKDRFKALYWTKSGFLLLINALKTGICNGRAIAVKFVV
ncbi:IS66 family insertion sequence element accessory protein TnpB [Lacticaseibacillus paracasei]|uniref:IS66 family insertion sequence element accessory protein TnpB n=1 Tax=Lacticaseibacillus paracasei TaxID=1597 RepID=UPI0022E1B307|nr:IS66 family insertion sequence element accessory protein TnpB [Lacticaseibacillus paracasei]